MGEDAVDHLEQLKRRLVIELNHCQVAHERGSVQAVNDQLDLLRVQVGRFAEHFGVACIWSTEVLPLSCYKETTETINSVRDKQNLKRNSRQ